MPELKASRGRDRCAALVVGLLAALGCADRAIPERTDAATTADAATVIDAASASQGGKDATVADLRLASDGPDPVAGGSGAFAVAWKLSWLGLPARPLGCSEAGVATLVLEGSDGASRSFREELPCAAGHGASRALPAGRYQVKLSVTDAAGVALAAQSGSYDLRPGSTDLGEVGFELQSFELAWMLRRAQRAVTCAEVSAATVVLVAQYGAEAPVNHQFPCGAGHAQTVAVRQGDYSLALRLLGPTGAVLAQTQAMAFAVSDDRRATLPAVTFDVP
jgi:hypothetical protein